jgi:uncharacterized membrane protein
MLKKIWHFAGDIKTSFVLLMLASLILFTGSMYGNNYFALFRALNRIRVQDWLLENMAANLSVIWWVPVLFIVMGCLGLNTFICATNRVANLLPRRHFFSKMRFFYLLIPSIIHCLFIFIMLGHLITFTAGKWETIPLKEGVRVDIGKGGVILTVTAIKESFFSETSEMRDRINQTYVTLVDNENREIMVQYLRPVIINGHFLFLDKTKKKKIAQKGIDPADGEIKETCDQAHVYHGKTKKQSGLLLLVISDPGLCMIIVGLSVIMMLMVWYFIFPNKGHKNGNDKDACH